MKSPIVTAAFFMSEEEKAKYSELQVLKSAAGYYIGTLYNNPAGFTEPGSRDSDYFKTEEEAEKYLAMVLNSANPQEYLRDAP